MSRGFAIMMAVAACAAGAVVVPSLLRSRTAPGEDPGIGDVRTVLSAETAYQAVNGGFFDVPECLGAPQRCIPGYDRQGPAFLDTALASLETRGGYRRSFQAGPSAPPRKKGEAAISASSVSTFAYLAVSDRRGICGDSTGRICVTPGGVTPRVRDGECDPSSCKLLR